MFIPFFHPTPSAAITSRSRRAVTPLVLFLALACAPEGERAAAPAGAGAARGTSAGRSPAAPELVPATAAEVLAAVAASDGEAILVNVWATWCQPCREEFPDLIRLHRELGPRGLRLILVSADFENQRQAARRFLADQGVDFPSYVKTGKDMEFIDTLDERWSGALPASWVFDATGRRRHFWENKAPYDRLRSAVLDVLDGAEARTDRRP